MKFKKLEKWTAEIFEEGYVPAIHDAIVSWCQEQMLAKDIVEVTLEQYTPYFNDGDQCTFSIHDFKVTFNDGSTLDIDPPSWRKPAQFYKEAFEFADTIYTLNPLLLQLAFGDHRIVTINVKDPKPKLEYSEHE